MRGPEAEVVGVLVCRLIALPQGVSPRRSWVLCDRVAAGRFAKLAH